MQNHIAIQSQGLTLRGYLHAPDTSYSKIPLICLFHGFTGNKMESHYQFVKLSRELEKHGIASLRVDFAHSGESDGNFEKMTLSGEIEDARNILKYVYELDFVDKSRIGLLGFSMGGVVASIIAAEMKENIKTLCLLAPAGNIENILSEFFVEDNIVADVNGLLLSRKAYENAKKIITYEKAKGFDKKVLIIHGTHDETVPMDFGRKYAEIYGKNARFHPIFGANHTFDKKEWENEVIETVIDYLKQNI